MEYSEIDPNFDPMLIHLYNEKVKVLYNDKIYVGKLTFAGLNYFNLYQVTIDRFPIWPIDPKNVKKYE